jgi:DNA-binding CsgD family transcriptional regulator
MPSGTSAPPGAVSMTTNAPRLFTAEEALATGTPLLALKAHALSAVVALVPASVVVFTTLSRRLALQDAVTLQNDRLRAPSGELWRRYLLVRAHDPFASERTVAAVVLGLEEVTMSEPYAAFLRDAGIGDVVTMYLRVSGTIGAGITLVRSAGQQPFSRREAITLRRVQPLMQHAYACAVSPATNGTHDVLQDSGLTTREADVAELVGRGATNAEIARTLHLSEATVKTHLSHIYAKVGVTSRTQLAILVGGQLGRG